MTRRRWILLGALAAVVVCVGVLWGSLNLAPAPSGYTSVKVDVAFYPVCGADTLEVDGRTWYSMYRDWQGPDITALGVTGGRGIGAGVPMVSAPPGPGDDVGTLYVYPQGVAYWVSDSGGFHQWLTLVPQRHDWVC